MKNEKSATITVNNPDTLFSTTGFPDRRKGIDLGYLPYQKIKEASRLTETKRAFRIGRNSPENGM
ncbi:MAG TPA: hypothetical protein VMC44_04610 [Geobacteraceae bacterium]|nr:hypothetical protein [Geobacteraceae bacterium]